MTDDDLLFRALADPTRRRVLDRLRRRNGQPLGELCAGLGMARQSATKHLAVLEEAGLVTVRWQGREKLHFLDAAPVLALTDRWIGPYRRRAEAVADLRAALESTTTGDAMTDPTSAAQATDFVYTIYVRTTPERLWEALVDPAFTSRYWGVELASDWSEGAPVTWRYAGATMADPRQRVLAADRPRLLSYTWHAVTDEFTRAVGGDPEEWAAAAAEELSWVRFELEPLEGQVRLTVTHGGFGEDSVIRPGVGQGWPQILSSLKTLVETGEPLPA